MTDPLSKTFRVVRINPSSPEPSLDPAKMAELVPTATGGTITRAGQYILTRDEGLLAFREGGGEPTWFHLRRMSAAFMCEVLDGVFNPAAQRLLAFRAACHEIAAPGDPMKVSDAGSKARFVAGAADHGVSLAPPEWVEEVAERYGLETVQEIGRAAIDHSRLPRGARGPFGYWGGSVATL